VVLGGDVVVVVLLDVEVVDVEVEVEVDVEVVLCVVLPDVAAPAAPAVRRTDAIAAAAMCPTAREKRRRGVAR
jgi:hypothetical protein